MDNNTGTELEQPLISVVIAVYNGQDAVGRAISSVLRQTHPNIEVVIVDDGSTDNTSRVLEGYEALGRAGREIRVLRQEHTGRAVARNTALEVVSGDFITFLDAEDTLLPHHLGTLLGRYEDVATSESGSRTVVCANAFLCTAGGINAGRLRYREKLPDVRRQRSVILDRNFGSLYGLFPRYFFAEVGVFDPEQVCVQTWELWLRAIYSGWRVDRVEQVTSITWWSEDSKQKHQECLAAGEERALRQTLRRFDGKLSTRERAAVQRRLKNGSALVAASQAEQALREGRGEDAKEHLRRTAEMMPTQRRVRIQSAIANLPGGTRWLVNRQRAEDRCVGYTEHLQC
ncbi:glycosyltransferase family 2 protein [Kocuria sp. cx-116]|uniref:glycosyltransferase family 2 protein n=1 Tax=Kocuria sp. cx-116 TaxID=2771378 RepID=UPI001682964C|nr:glycosyltransferase family 2 protein [Kocuria sp. cx-116]MBD2762711.1 glycosyltransferase family 2 protein [Kocuria sp. cx-116]